MAERALGGVPPSAKADELPFDADRRCMSTVHDTAHRRMLYCKGAPEVVLPMCGALDATQVGPLHGVAEVEPVLVGDAQDGDVPVDAGEVVVRRGAADDVSMALDCRPM